MVQADQGIFGNLVAQAEAVQGLAKGHRLGGQYPLDAFQPRDDELVADPDDLVGVADAVGGLQVGYGNAETQGDA